MCRSGDQYVEIKVRAVKATEERLNAATANRKDKSCLRKEEKENEPRRS